jgi:hypothetical protein
MITSCNGDEKKRFNSQAFNNALNQTSSPVNYRMRTYLNPGIGFEIGPTVNWEKGGLSGDTAGTAVVAGVN